jgi:hypothetical protein
LALADWLYATAGQTHQLAMERLFDLLHAWLTGPCALDRAWVEAALLADYVRTGGRGKLGFMAKSPYDGPGRGARARGAAASTPSRQARHLPA